MRAADTNASDHAGRADANLVEPLVDELPSLIDGQFERCVAIADDGWRPRALARTFTGDG